MRLHATIPSALDPTEAYDQEVWEATDSIDRKLDEMEAARDWDYRLPEQYQDEVKVSDYQPLSDTGWDYQLPERYRY